MIVRLTPDRDAYPRLAHGLRQLGAVGELAARARFAAAAPQITARQRALAPVDAVDGGQMRDSIRHGGPRTRGKEFVAVEFVVGGDVLLPFLGRRAANVYALLQETDTSLRHRRGQAGFMTQPVAQMSPGVFERVAADVDALVARVSG